MTTGVIPKPHLPRDFSGKLINGHVARLIFCNWPSMLGVFEEPGSDSAGEAMFLSQSVYVFKPLHLGRADVDVRSSEYKSGQCICITIRE
jgi:hypothetical protein